MEAVRAEALVAPCVPSKRPWGYRNKVELACGRDAAGNLAVGMHAPGSAGIVAVDRCPLAHKAIERAPKALRGALRFALGPELESRGSWGMYVFMLVCTVFAALDAAFPMTMFYLQHCCDVRDPEPSDFYLACQKAGWVVFPLLLLGGYCYALRVIP